MPRPPFLDQHPCGWLRPAALVSTLVGTLVAVQVGGASDTAPLAVDFSRQVRPLLAENCFVCHGPDDKARKARLRLDTRQGALGQSRGGTPIIVPGKSTESELITRITARDASEVMPPPASGKKLTTQQIDLLRRWIDGGAPWATHWAFVPPQRPAPPPVAGRAWVRNPIDRLVLSRLETRAWKPSPEAAKETLLRRVSLDLTGLPPTPEELDAFL